MKDLILWGTGRIGTMAYYRLSSQCRIVAWGDNDPHKQGGYYQNIEILGEAAIREKHPRVGIAIALQDYYSQARSLSEKGFPVIGYYDADAQEILPWGRLTWQDIARRKTLHLYAGDLLPSRRHQFPDDMVCLSITRSNFYTVFHDITQPCPLPDNAVDAFLSEDVFEHIEKGRMPFVLGEIHRILKHGAYLRMALPDYNCPAMRQRSFLDGSRQVVFDPLGGGSYAHGQVGNGGHLWFPHHDEVERMLRQSPFRRYEFYLYHTRDGRKRKKAIDYAKGFVLRTEENGKKDQTIIVDAWKD